MKIWRASYRFNGV